MGKGWPNCLRLGQSIASFIYLFIVCSAYPPNKRWPNHSKDAKKTCNMTAKKTTTTINCLLIAFGDAIGPMRPPKRHSSLCPQNLFHPLSMNTKINVRFIRRWPSNAIILFIFCCCASLGNEKRVANSRISGGGVPPPAAVSSSRPRRQSALQYPTVYYICGEFPNLAYQLTPCQRCRNGGRALYAQCTSAVQCTPYHRGPTECIDGQCCTGNDLDINYPDGGIGLFDPYQNGAQGGYVAEQSEGFCPQGFRSMIRCSARGQCPPDQSCLNGVCCRRDKNDYVEACGGQMAIAQCVAGYCQDMLVCNTANFCCQCPVGRSMGRCNQGVCPPGFRCQSNGFCCASCPDNAMPFGVCTSNGGRMRDIPIYRNGQRQLNCPIGYSCLQGDICCKNTII